MAAPDYVPAPVTAEKHYKSPPKREGAWSASRPGETFGQAPGGLRQGAQGPDQGFALTLTKVFTDDLVLTDGEYKGDVNAGCVGVATKRASIFHRAPVVHDLRIAYTLFGYLDPKASPDLIEFRKEAFAEIHYSFHYFEQRAIADMVSEEVLAQSPDQVAARYQADWRDQLDI